MLLHQQIQSSRVLHLVSEVPNSDPRLRAIIRAHRQMPSTSSLELKKAVEVDAVLLAEPGKSVTDSISSKTTWSRGTIPFLTQNITISIECHQRFTTLCAADLTGRGNCPSIFCFSLFLTLLLRYRAPSFLSTRSLEKNRSQPPRRHASTVQCALTYYFGGLN